MSRIKNVSAGVSRLRNEIDVDAYEQEANLVAASRALASLTAVRRLIARLRLEALRSHPCDTPLSRGGIAVIACRSGSSRDESCTPVQRGADSRVNVHAVARLPPLSKRSRRPANRS